MCILFIVFSSLLFSIPSLLVLNTTSNLKTQVAFLLFSGLCLWHWLCYFCLFLTTLISNTSVFFKPKLHPLMFIHVFWFWLLLCCFCWKTHLCFIFSLKLWSPTCQKWVFFWLPFLGLFQCVPKTLQKGFSPIFCSPSNTLRPQLL